MLGLLYVRDHFPILRFFCGLCWFLFPRRDYDQQTLNLTFTANVVKTGLFASLFPEHSSGVWPPLSVILCH
jgi:hypothetical protein